MSNRFKTGGISFEAVAVVDEVAVRGLIKSRVDIGSSNNHKVLFEHANLRTEV